MHVFDLVEQGARAAQDPNPCAAVRGMLKGLCSRLEEVNEALDFCGCTDVDNTPDRQIFYRSPNLAMMRIFFGQGLRTPPHDHSTWAAILILSGREKNTFYRRCGVHGLQRIGEKILEPGSVFRMDGNAIHVVECADQPSVALHVYGGDLDQLPRSIWHPHTLEEFAMETDRYEEFSRLASADCGPPGSAPSAAPSAVPPA